MKITVLGGTGFLGRPLAQKLQSEGHAVSAHGRAEPTPESLAQADAVINLAGEPVAQRWTDRVKKEIADSRLERTSQLVQTLSRQPRKPSMLVNASAIGIYGARGEEILTEASRAGTGFLADLSVDWEQAALAAEGLGIRVVMPRISIVLGKNGGALAKMLPPFRFGMGAALGSGQQWMSWIHLDDMLELISFALRTPSLKGPVNAAAPNPVRNVDFTHRLGAALHRPAALKMPRFALKLAMGDVADVMLASQRVLPQKAEAAGFRFKFPELTPALENLLSD